MSILDFLFNRGGASSGAPQQQPEQTGGGLDALRLPEYSPYAVEDFGDNGRMSIKDKVGLLNRTGQNEHDTLQAAATQLAESLRSDRRAQQAEMLSKIGGALLSPTRSGTFAESMGKAATVLGETTGAHSEADMARKQALAQMYSQLLEKQNRAGRYGRHVLSASRSQR